MNMIPANIVRNQRLSDLVILFFLFIILFIFAVAHPHTKIFLHNRSLSQSHGNSSNMLIDKSFYFWFHSSP